MAITTCQKVTLISCSVLCVSLFLPKMLLPGGKKDKGQPEVGPGFYPSVMHQFSAPDDPEQWNIDLSPSLTHTVEATVKVKSSRRGKKYNLMAQIIPIYGFGILLYILYIIYKLTSKKKTNTSGIYSPVKMTGVKPSDSELERLQQRLLRAEMMMERLVSGKSHCSSRSWRSKSSTSKKEEKLLRQIRQITLLMQEGRLEGASPEMEAEEVPYGTDWEGYPEETYPEYDEVPVDRRGVEDIRPEEFPSQPTAEALAERMEQEEEEIMARKLSVVQEEEEEEEDKEKENDEEEEEVVGEEEDVGEVEDVDAEESSEEEEEEVEEEEEKKHLLPPAPPTVERKQERVGLEVSGELHLHSGGKKQISFSDHKHIFHYPKEETYEEEEEGERGEEDEGTEIEDEEEVDDDEDPLMEAESLLFSCEGSSNPEDTEEEKEECLHTSTLMKDEGQLHVNMPKDVGQSGLRMRNRRET